MNVSTEWTPEERLRVINTIAVGLYNDSAKGGVPRERVFRDSDRIALLSRASRQFLEDNREQILEGLK